MKAVIKVCTANKDFTDDQKQILRRISIVLREHNLYATQNFHFSLLKNSKSIVSSTLNDLQTFGIL